MLRSISTIDAETQAEHVKLLDTIRAKLSESLEEKEADITRRMTAVSVVVANGKMNVSIA